MKEIKAYEASDGTKFYDKQVAESYEYWLTSTPTQETHTYRPSLYESCEVWVGVDYGWRDCYVVGMDEGDYGYVLQSYEAVWFECDEIFRKKSIKGEEEHE